MLETIGYDAQAAASFAPWDAADASVGRVVRVERGVLTVLAEDGPHRVTLGGGALARAAQDPTDAPCLGDWVVVRWWPDRRETVEHVLERRSTLVHEHVDPSRAQVLAANVDLVAVVLDSADPTVRRRHLGRLVTTAAAGGATPLLVLLGDPGEADEQGEDDGLGEEGARSVEVLRAPVDADGRAEVQRLRDLVDGRRTLALLGAGTATSVLTRSLVGADVIGGRRRRRGLTLLPDGGVVLDLGT